VGKTVNLDSVSDEELQAEIERRELAKIMPQPVAELNWAPVLRACEEYLGELAKGGGKLDDHETYVFESIMMAVYGKDIFERYINPILLKR